MTKSELTYPEGYSELNLPLGIGSSRSIFSNVDSTEGLFLHYLGHRETKEIHGFVKFGPLAGGPPLSAHGGSIAYVLDEAMGAAAWNKGFPVVSESIAIRYKHIAPQKVLLQFHAQVEKVEAHRLFVRGQLQDSAGKVLTESDGYFHILDAAQIKGFAEKAGIEIPEGLRKFMKPKSSR